MLKTQAEWEFLQLTVSRRNVTMQGKVWENLIYTVRERRRVGPLQRVLIHPDP